MEESLKQLYDEPEDERVKTVHTEIYPITGQEVTYCAKFPADKNPVWPIIRLSEMYLIVAESKARRGTIDVTEFNILRDKRHASLKENIDFKDAATFLDEIENERRREFAAEGLRWMDMRRFNRIESFLEDKGVDKRRVHFPIYIGEITNNPLLKQTDYYTK
jgi:hypothetical protein